jgi:hypothetical protein
MNIAQVRAQLEDALRDKNKGLRVPQQILDIEYNSNKEFRELNAQVRDKAGMGRKRKHESEAAGAAKPSKSKSKPTADTAPPAPKRPKTKAEPTPDLVPKKPRIKEEEVITKQTAKKIPSTTRDEKVDVKPPGAAKARTKQTARKTVQPADDLDDIEELHAPRTKTTARKTGAVASSSSTEPSNRTKQTARRGRPFPAPPSRSAAPRSDSVSGHWEIHCQYIAEQWDIEDMTFNIVGNGTALDGEFDLGIIQGLLHCGKVEERGANGAYATVRWAGQQDDGPVCPPNPGQSGYIKFTGATLKGKLNNVPACGNAVDFEGRWLGPAEPIRAIWDDCSEDAYERANQNRWR